MWASSFLLTASIGICICSPCDHRSLQHARYSSECPGDWGRVHEVRRSQPRLSGSLIHNGVAGLGLLATPCWAITFFHTFTVWLAVARTYGASMWVSPTFNALRLAGRQRFTNSLLKSGIAAGLGGLVGDAVTIPPVFLLVNTSGHVFFFKPKKTRTRAGLEGY